MADADDVSAQVALTGGGHSDLLSTIQGSPRLVFYSNTLN